jgi:hypothetical protein
MAQLILPGSPGKKQTIGSHFVAALSASIQKAGLAFVL